LKWVKLEKAKKIGETFIRAANAGRISGRKVAEDWQRLAKARLRLFDRQARQESGAQDLPKRASVY
jgi:hypothetical protein